MDGKKLYPRSKAGVVQLISYVGEPNLLDAVGYDAHLVITEQVSFHTRPPVELQSNASDTTPQEVCQVLTNRSMAGDLPGTFHDQGSLPSCLLLWSPEYSVTIR